MCTQITHTNINIQLLWRTWRYKRYRNHGIRSVLFHGLMKDTSRFRISKSKATAPKYRDFASDCIRFCNHCPSKVQKHGFTRRRHGTVPSATSSPASRNSLNAKFQRDEIERILVSKGVFGYRGLQLVSDTIAFNWRRTCSTWGPHCPVLSADVKDLDAGQYKARKLQKSKRKQ